MRLVSIPSTYYGSSIKKGSINCKWYLTGTLIAELQDIKRNGELIQTGPVGSVGSGSVAGVALYNEGFILITGSWSLHPTYTPGSLSRACSCLHPLPSARSRYLPLNPYLKPLSLNCP